MVNLISFTKTYFLIVVSEVVKISEMKLINKGVLVEKIINVSIVILK